MRKIFSIIVAIVVLFTLTIAFGEGALPSLDNILGVEMPSMRRIVLREPDEVRADENLGQQILFENISESDFDVWNEYIERFGCSLIDYNVQSSELNATIGKSECTMSFVYDNVTRIMKLTYPDGTKEEQVNIEKVKPYTIVGNTVLFGNYEQDDNIGNGLEPISWIVLKVEGNKSLLISEKALEFWIYDGNKNESDTSSPRKWEISYVRKWLNDDFLHIAFSQMEQDSIVMVKVPNNKEQGNGYAITLGDVDTDDKVFLLSEKEVIDFFPDEASRECHPTVYAANRFHGQAYDYDKETNIGSWSLRTRDDVSAWNMDKVYKTGEIRQGGYAGTAFIRPAIWVDILTNCFVE